MRVKPGIVKTIAAVICLFLHWSGTADASFGKLIQSFIEGYKQLEIPDPDYDFHTCFHEVADTAQLNRQERFFTAEERKFRACLGKKLSPHERLALNHVLYETAFNLKRLRLEKEWVSKGRKIPQQSLYELESGKEWYAFFLQRYTGYNLTPQEVYSLGEEEVRRVKAEIQKLQKSLGFTDSASFYNHLASGKFVMTDKAQVLQRFEHTDSTVRKHLQSFCSVAAVPPVYAMEWPNAGPNTPPGMYLNHEYNPYGKDVFQFNFFKERFNARAVEWIYMHEALPGHHLQSSLRAGNPNKTLQDLFLYPGNFEGWACYVEYHGKEVGLYTDPYSLLGKWEWDLVRSARLVIDAGIHYYGWTHEQALAYWKATIPGQADIAERETLRVRNWAAQAVSYKAGADFIARLKEKWMQRYKGQTEARFHHLFLETGTVPLEVLEKQLLQ